MQDKSAEYQKTWEFLNRRMEDGVSIQNIFNDSDQKTKNVTQAVGSAFKTVQNTMNIIIITA